MKMSEIQTILNGLPKNKPVLKGYKTGHFFIILNQANNDNIGYHLDYDYNGLRIEKFMREPYRKTDILTGYVSFTQKQHSFIKNYLVDNYFPELDYLKG